MLGPDGRGPSNTAIADRLTVTLKTVESHIANIFSKLGLHGARTTTAGCWRCWPR